MLMRILMQGAKDARTMAQRQVILAGGMLALGGLALVLWGTVVRSSGLGDIARGFYLGIGGGLAGSGGGYLVYSLWLWTHPDRAQAEFIKENDEREKLVADTGAKWAFYTLLFALLPAMMIAAPLNVTVFWTLFFSFMAMMLALLFSLALARSRL